MNMSFNLEGQGLQLPQTWNLDASEDRLLDVGELTTLRRIVCMGLSAESLGLQNENSKWVVANRTEQKYCGPFSGVYLPSQHWVFGCSSVRALHVEETRFGVEPIRGY